MCDYSVKGVKTRAAAKEDALTTQKISRHTTGFVGINDTSTAVCLLPGTELAFDRPIRVQSSGIINAVVDGIQQLIGPAPDGQTVATFVQVNKHNTHAHHDALKFIDGSIVLLNSLAQGQTATVVTLPADPSTLDGHERQVAEESQHRVEYN